MKNNERQYRRHPVLRAIILLALLATAVMIFLFSAQKGAESSEVSERVARFLWGLIGRDYDALSSAERQQALFFVRKGAHFLEYTALGLFLHLSLSIIVKKLSRTFVYSVLLGAIYAATDEYHQMLVGGRSGQWKDVALDSVGVLVGTALALLLLILWRRKHPLPCRRAIK